ncbi:MAG: hypothetical protein NT062_34115, partial [Proteobacteria bacterium]|nr:hypothetical protein [Pseudomonadota bacterium]
LNAAIPPMPASVPYSVQQLVRRALEKDPARRYQSAGEMMQHAQQIFAELNGGGVSIGAGGVPRTIVAPMPGISAPPMQQQQQPQQPQGGLANQGPGYQASAAGAKTMIAGISPFAANAPGGPMQQMQAPPQAQQPPYQNTGAQQKTIVAGMAPQIPNGQMMGMQAGMQSPGMQPPGMQPLGMGMPGMQPPGGGPSGGFNQPPSSGPNKTVMLQPSDGVISVARTPNQAVAPAGAGAVGTSGPSVQQGASTLFWIMSMLIGIGLGALAYVIVLQLQ